MPTAEVVLIGRCATIPGPKDALEFECRNLGCALLSSASIVPVSAGVVEAVTRTALLRLGGADDEDGSPRFRDELSQRSAQREVQLVMLVRHNETHCWQLVDEARKSYCSFHEAAQ